MAESSDKIEKKIGYKYKMIKKNIQYDMLLWFRCFISISKKIYNYFYRRSSCIFV